MINIPDLILVHLYLVLIFCCTVTISLWLVIPYADTLKKKAFIYDMLACFTCAIMIIIVITLVIAIQFKKL